MFNKSPTPTPMNYISQLAQQFPDVVSNPRNQEFMAVLQSGNQQAIENLADKICESYGITREQAMQDFPGFQKQYGIPNFGPPISMPGPGGPHGRR